RRHLLGAVDFAAGLVDAQVKAVRRRGKYLWAELTHADGTAEALLAHLGMSGQMLIRPADAAPDKHLRVRIAFADGGPQLWFVDQRTFGGLARVELVESGGELVPEPIA